MCNMLYIQIVFTACIDFQELNHVFSAQNCTCIYKINFVSEFLVTYGHTLQPSFSLLFIFVPTIVC